MPAVVSTQLCFKVSELSENNGSIAGWPAGTADMTIAYSGEQQCNGDLSEEIVLPFIRPGNRNSCPLQSILSALATTRRLPRAPSHPPSNMNPIWLHAGLCSEALPMIAGTSLNNCLWMRIYSARTCRICRSRTKGSTKKLRLQIRRAEWIVSNPIPPLLIFKLKTGARGDECGGPGAKWGTSGVPGKAFSL